MLAALLYIYLTGAVAITAGGSYICIDNKADTNTGCVTTSAAVGFGWPVITTIQLTDRARH